MYTFTLPTGNVSSGDVAIEMIAGMGVLILIVVHTAKVIEVTRRVLLLGQPPGKTHHRNKTFVTEHHFSFVTCGNLRTLFHTSFYGPMQQ